ncbi:MAG: hypothetical protein DRN92_05325 [Thermoproteota archaeon]|nr:MAG: hypothetical protein DRN92_05325 [Candidatus Korarchaeota archaeon]
MKEANAAARKKMRIIDGHVFVGKSIFMEQKVDDLLAEMDRLGIEASVIVAPPPGPFYEDANEFVMEAAKKHPNRLIPLYHANPQLEKEEERVRDALDVEGFVGIQLDPTNDGYFLRSHVVEPVVKVAEELGRPVYVHSGDSIFCPPEYVADLASKFESVNFITSMSIRAPRAARDRNNLYLLTRPFPTLFFKLGFAEEFDLDRLIFASDSPLDVAQIELRRIELAGLEPEVLRKILGDNLRRVLFKGA